MNRLTISKIPNQTIFEILVDKEPQEASLHFIDHKVIKCIGENCPNCITAKTLSIAGHDDWKSFIKHYRWVFKARFLDGTDFEFEAGNTVYKAFGNVFCNLKFIEGHRLYFYNDYRGKEIHMDLDSCRFIHRMKTVSRMYRMDGSKDLRKIEFYAGDFDIYRLEKQMS